MFGNNTTDIRKKSFQMEVWAVVWHSIILVVGVTGNLIVIIVISRSKYLRWRKSVFNMLLLTLALTDILSSVSGLPYYLLLSQTFHMSLENGRVFCKIYIGFFSPFLFLNTSQYILVSITLERKKVLLDTFKNIRSNHGVASLKYVLISILLASIIQFLISSEIQYVGKDDDITPTIGNNCFKEKQEISSVLIYPIVAILQTILPFTIMFISLRQMVTTIEKTVENGLQPFLSTYTKKYIKNLTLLQRKEKTIKMLKLVVVAFLICLLPNHIFLLFTYYMKKNSPSLAWNSVYYQACMLLWATNSCINPLLYFFYSKEFRNYAYRVFFKSPREKRGEYKRIQH